MTERNSEQLERDLADLHAQSWRWAISVCRGDIDLAQDVLQSAYLSVLEGKALWKKKSSFKTWFFGVIRITASAHRRRQSLLRFRFLAPLEDDVVAALPQFGEDPMSNTILTALKSLPPKQAQLSELVFGQDLTIEEAAKIMKISIGTARTHYSRAKASLRLTLKSLEAISND